MIYNNAVDQDNGASINWSIKTAAAHGTDSINTIVFPEVGKFKVYAIVTDLDLFDSISWNVKVIPNVGIKDTKPLTTVLQKKGNLSEKKIF